jgi:hypothetical protein
VRSRLKNVKQVGETGDDKGESAPSQVVQVMIVLAPRSLLWSM